jgi:hypothetical protein
VSARLAEQVNWTVDVEDLQATLVARYRGVPVAEAARVADVPVGFLRRARAALGRCPETGESIAQTHDAERDRLETFDRMMRGNRGVL